MQQPQPRRRSSGARKNGLREQDEPSEVRNLSQDAEARARAEEAMRQMMAKPQGKRRP